MYYINYLYFYLNNYILILYLMKKSASNFYKKKNIVSYYNIVRLRFWMERCMYLLVLLCFWSDTETTMDFGIEMHLICILREQK